MGMEHEGRPPFSDALEEERQRQKDLDSVNVGGADQTLAERIDKAGDAAAVENVDHPDLPNLRLEAREVTRLVEDDLAKITGADYAHDPEARARVAKRFSEGLVDRRTHETEAYADELTAIPNLKALRRTWLNRSGEPLDEEGIGPKIEGHSILYFDLDNFKAVNDTKGHAAGDRVLKRAASSIVFALEDAGYEQRDAYRIGGDEFAAIVRDQDATKVSMDAVSYFIHSEEEAIFDGATVGFSVGIGNDLHKADQQMYEQKRAAHGAKDDGEEKQ